MNDKTFFVDHTELKVTYSQKGIWTAFFTLPQPEWVLGSPLGKGDTRESAIDDLVRRTNSESRVRIQLIQRLTKDTIANAASFRLFILMLCAVQTENNLGISNTEFATMTEKLLDRKLTFDEKQRLFTVIN